MKDRFQIVAAYVLYPLLMALVVISAWAARALGLKPALAVVLCTIATGLVVVGLERVLPFRKDWGVTAENLKADLLHGIVSNGLPSIVLEGLLKASLLSLALNLRTQRGIDLWPDGWPLWTQVLLALFAAEVGFYTLHRLFHESGLEALWRLHATHHSTTRMYFLAGSRTHPLQVMFSFGVTVAILWGLGAPDEVIFWKTVIHTTNGILQHCNVDLRLGFLNWLIAGPELHRWHHSIEANESNHNYGNNLIVLDVILGTRYLPKAAPDRCGLPEGTDYDNNFLGHLRLPFQTKSKAENPEGPVVS